MKAIEKIFFPFVFIIAFIGLVDLMPIVVTLALTTAIIIYLAAGWYLLLPDKTGPVDRWIPFVVSYLIAQTLVTVLFGIKGWSMRESLAYVTLVMLIIATVVFFVFRKKLAAGYPVNEYIIRFIVCTMFAGSPLWMQ